MVKKLPWLTGLLLLLVVAGCDATGDGGFVMLSGQVTNASTENPVVDAVVRIPTLNSGAVQQTGADGRFSFEVEVDSITTLTVTAFKEGFNLGSAEVLAVPDRAVTVPTFRLVPTGPDVGGGEGGSGAAASVTVESISANSVSVLESGFQETTQVVFTVRDSSGVPVDLDNAADVTVRIAQGPCTTDPATCEVSEFVSPTRVRTNNNGQAIFNLTSGTKAGAVQLLAQVDADGRTIASRPVAIAIHGGLPDQQYFSIGPNKFNFPALGILGEELGIAAYAGDQYSNPVQPGTVIYFETTGGIIEGSAQTNEVGGAGVNLISARPFPADGYARIIARTADRNGDSVSDTTLVVFTGFPQIALIEPVPPLQIGGVYRYTVTDQNGNPLAEDTQVSVTMQGENVKVIGDTDVTLNDHLFGGPKITEFAFGIAKEQEQDDEGNELPSRIDGVEIEVTGPNGNRKLTITPGGSFRISPVDGR